MISSDSKAILFLFICWLCDTFVVDNLDSPVLHNFNLAVSEACYSLGSIGVNDHLSTGSLVINTNSTRRRIIVLSDVEPNTLFRINPLVGFIDLSFHHSEAVSISIQNTLIFKVISLNFEDSLVTTQVPFCSRQRVRVDLNSESIVFEDLDNYLNSPKRQIFLFSLVII